MPTENPSFSEIADELEQSLVSDTSMLSGPSTRSLKELYSAKTRELAQTYFNSDFRTRLLQELER